MLKDKQVTLLGQNGQPNRQVQYLPPHKRDGATWKSGYARVMIPYSEVELRNAKGGVRHHVQIVRTSGLIRGNGRG